MSATATVAIAQVTGRPFVGPLSGSAEEIVLVEFDLDRARAARHRSGLVSPRDDRRTEFYGLVYEDTRL